MSIARFGLRFGSVRRCQPGSAAPSVANAATLLTRTSTAPATACSSSTLHRARQCRPDPTCTSQSLFSILAPMSASTEAIAKADQIAHRFFSKFLAVVSNARITENTENTAGKPDKWVRVSALISSPGLTCPPHAYSSTWKP